jgi:hypothetical protein
LIAVPPGDDASWKKLEQVAPALPSPQPTT